MSLETDKEKLRALLIEMGVKIREEDDRICIDDDDNGSHGYTGFTCGFTFRQDGSFKHVGVWE